MSSRAYSELCNRELLNAVTVPFQKKNDPFVDVVFPQGVSNSSQCFFSGERAAALHSEESDAESSSDEEFIDPLQTQVVDKKDKANGSRFNKMGAKETDGKTMYGKHMPHQQAVRRGYQYQAANSTGYSDQGTSYPRQGNDRLTRRPRYSYQLERTRGYSDKEGPSQHRWDSHYRRPENLYQHHRVRRVKLSYHLARTPGYFENEASVGPQQCQWNSAFRRPVCSYQQANRGCSGCPDHEADARANQLPGNGRVRRVGVSYHLAKAPGYSEDEACTGPQQYQWNSTFSCPGNSYQQTISIGHFDSQEANHPAYQHQNNSPYVQSYQQTSIPGYSCNKANVCRYSYNRANYSESHQAHHRVQDTKVNRTSSQTTFANMQQETPHNEMGLSKNGRNRVTRKQGCHHYRIAPDYQNIRRLRVL